VINISISYKKNILQSKEVEGPFGDSLTWMIKTFREEFGIDISNYSLSQLKQSKGLIIIELRQDDLKNWRNNRLNDLGI
jgi:hypothetical protein